MRPRGYKRKGVDWMPKTRTERKRETEKKAKRRAALFKKKEKEAKEKVRREVGYLLNFEGFWEQNKPTKYKITSADKWSTDSSVEVAKSTSREVENLK